jgi:ectoine hydroxylase-related dioxygenase (phytanoyl-CoA dioxygenase family)
MLTTAHTDYFAMFGFAVLRGFLTDRAAALRAQADAAIRDAYAATRDEQVVDGISGHYLPMASRLTPVSASLACDDPRFIDAAEQLLGGPVIPECPEGVLYFAEAGWHTDDGIGARGVKFAAYFDALTAETGALRLLPGSHHPEQTARLAAYQRRQPPVRAKAEAAAYRASIPGYAADTEPGDVIAFDLHTWHASFGGRDRLAWTAIYQRCPETAQERDRALRSA